MCFLPPSLWGAHVSMALSPMGALGGGWLEEQGRNSVFKKGCIRVGHAVPPCPLCPSALLFLPLTSHCCNDGVSSEPYHRPLWRTLSSLTSACPFLLCNQRSSQMSRWDKWEPFPLVMAPEMGWSASLALPLFSFFSLWENTQAFSAFQSYWLALFPSIFTVLYQFPAFLLSFFWSFVNHITEFLGVLC